MVPSQGKVSVKEFKYRYPPFAVGSIYRHAKKIPSDDLQQTVENSKKIGKMSDRDQRILLRTILRLRILYESFTVKMLRIGNGRIYVSTRTETRYLNKNGCKYLILAKK